MRFTGSTGDVLNQRLWGWSPVMEPESGSMQLAMGACTFPGTLRTETVRI